jgi:phage shock protein PspC (stress-responsive transcriptional regulator)
MEFLADMNNGLNKNKLALIIGGILIALGLWRLLGHFLGPLLDGLWRVLGIVAGIAGAVAIIAVGILLVIAARKNKLDFPKNRKLYRSTRSKKIAGVCGGIAEYLNVEHATVRIITLIFALVSWYIVIPLYLMLWIIVPPDTESFNTWI